MCVCVIDLLCRSTPGNQLTLSQFVVVCEASRTPASSPHAPFLLQIPCKNQTKIHTFIKFKNKGKAQILEWFKIFFSSMSFYQTCSDSWPTVSYRNTGTSLFFLQNVLHIWALRPQSDKSWIILLTNSFILKDPQIF